MAKDDYTSLQKTKEIFYSPEWFSCNQSGHFVRQHEDVNSSTNIEDPAFFNLLTPPPSLVFKNIVIS